MSGSKDRSGSSRRSRTSEESRFSNSRSTPSAQVSPDGSRSRSPSQGSDRSRSPSPPYEFPSYRSRSTAPRRRSHVTPSSGSESHHHDSRRSRSPPRPPSGQASGGHHAEVEEEEEEFFPNPFPARPVYNNPAITKKEEEESTEAQEHPFPSEWAYSNRVRYPPVGNVAQVYLSRREAWEKTGWVHCDNFLGKGGFGTVYLGFRWDDRYKNDKPMTERRLCAIKEVRIRSEDMLISLDEEIAMENYVLKACVHPNIIRMYTSYCVLPRNKFYFVMEYADGRDLRHEIQTKYGGAPLWKSYARLLFRGIVEGCCYLYDKGIGHCDLKPDNILLRVSSDGQNNIPKIADFGLSTVFRGQQISHNPLTYDIFSEDRPCGTRSYMAPEVLFLKYPWRNLDALLKSTKYGKAIPVAPGDVALGLKDPRNDDPVRKAPVYSHDMQQRQWLAPCADVWALGVTLYEMLAAERPFNPDPRSSHFDLIFRGEPIRNAQHIDDPTFQFICEMLQPDSEHRILLPDLREHAWMKGHVSGPGMPPERNIPAPEYARYVTPSESEKRSYASVADGSMNRADGSIAPVAASAEKTHFKLYDSKDFSSIPLMSRSKSASGSGSGRNRVSSGKLQDLRAALGQLAIGPGGKEASGSRQRSSTHPVYVPVSSTKDRSASGADVSASRPRSSSNRLPGRGRVRLVAQGTDLKPGDGVAVDVVPAADSAEEILAQSEALRTGAKPKVRTGAAAPAARSRRRSSSESSGSGQGRKK